MAETKTVLELEKEFIEKGIPEAICCSPELHSCLVDLVFKNVYKKKSLRVETDFLLFVYNSMSTVMNSEKILLAQTTISAYKLLGYAGDQVPENFIELVYDVQESGLAFGIETEQKNVLQRIPVGNEPDFIIDFMPDQFYEEKTEYLEDLIDYQEDMEHLLADACFILNNPKVDNQHHSQHQPGTWNWAQSQMRFGRIVTRSKSRTNVKYLMDKTTGLIMWDTSTDKTVKKLGFRWKPAQLAGSDLDAGDWVQYIHPNITEL